MDSGGTVQYDGAFRDQLRVTRVDLTLAVKEPVKRTNAEERMVILPPDGNRQCYDIVAMTDCTKIKPGGLTAFETRWASALRIGRGTRWS